MTIAVIAVCLAGAATMAAPTTTTGSSTARPVQAAASVPLAPQIDKDADRRARRAAIAQKVSRDRERAALRRERARQALLERISIERLAARKRAWAAEVRRRQAVRAAAAAAAAQQPAPAPVKTVTQAAEPGLGIWDRLAECESGGDWSANTGNGFYGGIQFTLSSWRAVGGSGLPSDASRGEQIMRGRILQQQQGWDAWPVCSRKVGLR